MARDSSKRGKGKSKAPARNPDKTSTGHRSFTSDLPRPKKAAYNTKELVRELTAFNRKPIEERLSAHHIQELRAPIRDPRNKQELHETLSRYLKLFDRAFFWGALRPRIKDLKVVNRIPNSAPGAHVQGHWNPATDEIVISFEAVNDHINNKGADWLCTLLHEMVHGFIFSFGCACRRYCAKKQRAEAGGQGNGGHGATFCNAAIAVQRSFQAEVGWTVDLGLSQGVRDEMATSGWTPRPEQLARWGVDLDGYSEAGHPFEGHEFPGHPFAGLSHPGHHPFPAHPFPPHHFPPQFPPHFQPPHGFHPQPPHGFGPPAPPSEAWAGRAFNPDLDSEEDYWSGSESDHETVFPDNVEPWMEFADDHMTFMGSDLESDDQTVWPGAGRPGPSRRLSGRHPTRKPSSRRPGREPSARRPHREPSTRHPRVQAPVDSEDEDERPRRRHGEGHRRGPRRQEQVLCCAIM